ncbi:MBL fold metallo-hydrolase [Rhizobium sp. 11_C7_N12_5]|uniref:MBL fold metallo-hydrolase n=1 Tax=Rhizobium sp. 11_C7_N12_5 TaxID=3240770 RepID=UPI003F1F3138
MKRRLFLGGPDGRSRWAARRALNVVFLVACSIFTAMLFAGHALAAAPQVGTQAPGFYRMMLGNFEITALSDGTHPFPVHKVFTKSSLADGQSVPLDQSSPGEADALLAESKLSVPVAGSINAFLINTGSKLILIDSGAGSLYGDCCGHLIANMRAAGYAPEQVDEIYLTHLHADHVGGIAPNGKMAFPNAVVRVSQADADYWLKDANEAAAPSLLKSMFEGDKASLKPYIDAGRFKPFSYGDELAPGIKPIAGPGHPPGHSFFEVESNGAKLLLWGDVVHVAPMQFPDPAITVAYDSDAGMAESVRLAVFADAAQKGYWIGAAHISFPGLGHVSAKDGHFFWVPANYDAAPGTGN